MKPTIFVVGVTGVGKSTVCRRFAQRHPNFGHFEASAFVKSSTGVASDQTALTTAIRSAIEAAQCEAAIVSGHVIVRGEPVSLKAIKALSPAVIVVLLADPSQIAFWRASDPRRPRPVESLAKIASDQAEEVREARRLAIAFGANSRALDQDADPELDRIAEDLIPPTCSR